MTQGQLGELVGAVQSAVNAWERGKNEPTLATFARIAEATGRTPEWLAFGVEPVAPPIDGAMLLNALERFADLVTQQHQEAVAAVTELAERVRRLERERPRE